MNNSPGAPCIYTARYYRIRSDLGHFRVGRAHTPVIANLTRGFLPFGLSPCNPPPPAYSRRPEPIIPGARDAEGISSMCTARKKERPSSCPSASCLGKVKTVMTVTMRPCYYLRYIIVIDKKNSGFMNRTWKDTNLVSLFI